MNKFVAAFSNCVDGVDIYPPEIEGIGTFAMGVCKLEFKGTSLHVYLRRPGILIGRKGETLKKVEEYVGCKIKVHEVALLRGTTFC